ncbi:hypothetical protein LQZ18_10970 [Lachnospiraceae bacterium ZAX-1]
MRWQNGITELADRMVYLGNQIDFYTEHFGIEKYLSKPTLSRILNMVDGDTVGKITSKEKKISIKGKLVPKFL